MKKKVKVLNVHMTIKDEPRDGPKRRDGRGKFRFSYTDGDGRPLILRKVRHGRGKGTFRRFTEEEYQRHLARRGD